MVKTRCAQPHPHSYWGENPSPRHHGEIRHAMSESILEHANVTVRDPSKTAKQLCQIFGWHIRWQGASKDDGYTVHVGTSDHYLALYRPSRPVKNEAVDSYIAPGGLNHLGIVVDDLEAVEAKVVEAGYLPHSHANYRPGRRFYFNSADDLEIEVISYSRAEA